MKQPERDDLLIRLDEKMNNVWRVVEQLEKHQIVQNGLIRDTIDQTTKNTTWIKAYKWIIGGIGTALAIGLTHLQGLW